MFQDAPLIAPVLFVALLAALELGRRLRLAYERRTGVGEFPGTGAIEAAIYALFGLLLAFTFSGAAGRFEQRRALVVQESNAIGTAYLRVDLLDAPAQGQLRPLFRAYVQARLKVYEALSRGTADLQTTIDHANKLQNQIWQTATEGAKRASSPAVMSLVLPPINDMIDITTTRAAAARSHPPTIIYALLTVFALAGALVAGFGLADAKRRPWLHVLLYSVFIAGTLYVIVDLEFPRYGVIRVDSFDTYLQQVLASMQP